MALGNDGNYLQHSIEAALAYRLAILRKECRLHIAFTHGMAPFEPCESLPPNPPAYNLFDEALNHAEKRRTAGKPVIVRGYELTKASRKRYPNSGEIVAELVGGRQQLTGGITENDDPSSRFSFVGAGGKFGGKFEALQAQWRGTTVAVAKSSWRDQVGQDGILACPPTLQTPWLFSMDPMSYAESGGADDNRLYRADETLLRDVLARYVQSNQPGAASLFVYSMNLDQRPTFWKFADDIAQHVGMSRISCWLPHRGGNRNLAAVLYTNDRLPTNPREWLPDNLKYGEE
jgi:hypothetical protein